MNSTVITSPIIEGEQKVTRHGMQIGVKLIWPENRKIDNSIELNLFESRVGNSETFSSYFFKMVAFGFFFQLEVCRLSVGLL